jgi:LemA protein
MKKTIFLALILPVLITAAFFVVVFVFAMPDSSQSSLPEPTGFVNDFAGVMNQQDIQATESHAATIREKTGAQMAVVTVKSYEPWGSIDGYSLALAEKWGIGEKGKDTGVLLILAVSEREVKIEVGYGLEGAIPDSATGRILDAAVLPAFRANNFSGGLARGAEAIAAYITKENGIDPVLADPSAAPAVAENSGQKDGFDFVTIILFFIVPILIFMLRIFLAQRFPETSSRSRGFGSGSSFGSSGSSFGGGFGGFGGGGFGGGGSSRSFEPERIALRRVILLYERVIQEKENKMKKIIIIGIIAVVVLGLVVAGGIGLWYISTRNDLVRLDETINQSMSEIDNQLQRRSDLIPNFVNTVKGYAAHEEEVFSNIAEARSRLMGARTVEEKSEGYNGMQSALSRLLVIAEQYPDLKANQNFIALQDELAGTENRIAVARKRYNDSVSSFNVRIRSFPGSLVAGNMGFAPHEYFEINETARQVPQVNFN